MTTTIGPLTPEEVHRRLQAAGEAAAAKAFDPHQPRGEHTGQWVKTPGTPDLTSSEKLGLQLEKGLKGTGITADQPGTDTTLTPADVKQITTAARMVTKKFPELTKPKKKGWKGGRGYPFGRIEFISERGEMDSWGQNLRAVAKVMTEDGAVGAGTSPDTDDGYTVKMAINDDPELNDGIHTIHTNPDARASSAAGARDTEGTVIHELGHALSWEAGVHGRYDPSQRDGIWRDLFAEHGLSEVAHGVSPYGASSASEAFAEIFADYMKGVGTMGKDHPGDRERFENLLAEILGRKVGDSEPPPPSKVEVISHAEAAKIMGHR